MVMVSPEPKSQLRQFSSASGIRVVLAPPMVVAPAGRVSPSAAKAAGTAMQSSTTASISAAHRRANFDIRFKFLVLLRSVFYSV